MERIEKAAIQEADRRSRELEQQREEVRKQAEVQALLPIALQELQEWEQYAQQIQIEYELGLASASQLTSARSRIRSQLERVTQLEHRLNPTVVGIMFSVSPQVKLSTSSLRKHSLSSVSAGDDLPHWIIRHPSILFRSGEKETLDLSVSLESQCVDDADHCHVYVWQR